MIKNYRNIFLLVGMLLVLIINIFLATKKNKQNRRRRRYSKYRHEQTLYINSNLIYIFFIVISITLYFCFPDNISLTDDNEISEKISTISGTLKETSTELSNIQQLLEARIEFVENLKKEAEIAENVISLSEDQVNAVQSKISQELNASNGKNTIISFMLNAFFFALGLIIQPIINYFKHKKDKNIDIDIGKDIDKDTDYEQYLQEELIRLLINNNLHDNTSSNGK